MATPSKPKGRLLQALLLFLLLGTASVAFVSWKPKSAAREEGRVTWYTDSREAMRIAREKGLPMIIDFGAEWCEACHDLEATVFQDPRFLARMKHFVPLRIDVTNNSPENDRTLEAFGVQSLPTVVFVSREGKVLNHPRVVGVIPTESFLELMNQL